MILVNPYQYKVCSGLIKCAIQFDVAEDRRNLSLRVGNINYQLGFESEWISKHDRVEFGLNSYRLVSQPRGNAGRTSSQRDAGKFNRIFD